MKTTAISTLLFSIGGGSFGLARISNSNANLLPAAVIATISKTAVATGKSGKGSSAKDEKIRRKLMLEFGLIQPGDIL